jgi:hypothetical protein
MISLEDCFALCGLTSAEELAVSLQDFVTSHPEADDVLLAH